MDVMKHHIKSEVLISPDDMKEEITVEPLITFLPEHEVHSPKVEGCSYVKPVCNGEQYENSESTVVYIKDEHDEEEQVSDTCNEILAEEWNENECETILGMEEDENIRKIFLKDKIEKDEDEIENTSTKPESITLLQQQTNEISIVEESLQDPIEENSEINENEPADTKGSTSSENIEVVYDFDDSNGEGSAPSDEDCTNIDDYGNESANTDDKIDCNPSLVVGPDYGYYIQLPQYISENGIDETNIDGSANTENSEVYAISDDDCESPSRLENEDVRPVIPDTGGSILRAALLKGSKHINYTQQSQVYILNKKDETPNNYKCSVCGKSFKKAVSVQIHYGLKHFKQQDSNSFPCSICDKIFTSRIKLLKHSRTHNLLFKCIICDKQFSERFRLKNHLKIHADESPASCPVCGKYFKKKKFLDDHMLYHGVGREFACSICKKSFSKLSRLKQHSVVHDGIVSVEDV